MNNTVSALQQWVKAFNHVSRIKRAQLGTTRIEVPLYLDEAFSSMKGTQLLFGQMYLLVVLKKGNRKRTLKQVEAA